MNSKKFSNSLGDIDESYVNEAITYKPNKKSKPWIRWVSLAACLCIVVSAAFAAFNKGLLLTPAHAEDLMEGIEPNNIQPVDDLDAYNASARNFAVELLKKANEDGENVLISPLSVLYALSMTLNGAEGETRAQMEEALGMSAEELNIYLYSYMNSLPQGEKYQVNIANSIWVNDNKFKANQSFLQANADYYGADIYASKFNDQVLDKINNWVNEKTDGMIPSIIDEIPEDAVMYLINALLFEAEWAEKYEKQDVSNKTFTKEDGTRQLTRFMYSNEGTYLEDDNAVGFVKYYNMAKYAFVALLPNEDITVSEYLSTLDGNSISELLENKKYITVKAAMPKFEVEYDNEMSSILKSMGITDAFDNSRADFDGMGKSDGGNIYINRVIHKTYIKVSEIGTKAGAVTSVEVQVEGIEPIPKEFKTVHLDRPFVYMIIDCENNIPLFMGTMMDVKG